MQDKLVAAVELHQAGKLAEAEALYRRVLSVNPNHPEALHFLGVLAGQVGRGADGAQLIQRAIDAKPDYVDAYSNLGRILFDLGRHDEAIHCYRRVTELKRSDATAWFSYGLVLRSCGKAADAMSAFQKAISLRSSHAESHSELGNLLRSAGRLDEAVQSHIRAVSLSPNSADAHNNLANALLDQGKVQEAINEFMAAVSLDMNRPVFHCNLAGALVRVDRLDDAIVAYDYAIRLQANNVDALTGKATAHSQKKEYEIAEQLFRRSLELRPNDISTLVALAGMHYQSHKVDQAEEIFKSIIELNPRSIDAWIGLGQTQRANGRFDESAQSFRRAIEIDPNSAIALKNLTAIGVVSDPEMARLEALMHRSDLSNEDRVATGFGLGKLLDDAERFDEAFERYHEANALYKKMRAAEADVFDAAALKASVDWQLRTFDAGYFQQTRDWGNPTDVPVFVVGMPRSGTTLVEQIAASHPKVFGAGELTDIGDIAKECMTHADPVTGCWSREMVAAGADRHIARLTSLAPGAVRIVDKMPANIINLAMISDLFPNARVIFCRRDPRDTCLSCYFQWFGRNSQIFSYDLKDCAAYYQQQDRLVSHWAKHLPLKMITMQYEETVADLEGQSRRLIDFLGLEWDARCLEFHKTKRTVSTASVWQVRQPIYTSSVGRWKHYEKHLGPLIAGLGL